MAAKKPARKASGQSPTQPPTKPAKVANSGPPAKSGDLLEMADAIAMLKTTRPTFYRWLREGRFRGMKVGRQWRFERGEIDRFLRGEEPRIELRGDMKPLLKTLEDRARTHGIKATSLPADNDVQRALKLMLELGAAMASDFHLSPHMSESSDTRIAHLRYRIDGVLYTIAQFDVRLLPPIIEQWKIAARMNLHESRPQDGRLTFNVAGESKPVDVRVCIVPTQMGDSLTARVLRADATAIALDKIDYSPRDREKILRALHRPWGLILVTGPTGCGKTTALYSCLSHYISPEVKIMTIEDPVEFSFPWMEQVSVNPKEGVSFASAIRAFLRSAPNIIMVGEIRDLDVLGICQQAALTGHMVLTTLHAEDAVKALQRMLEMGSPPFLVADCTRLIISQRLVRRLCPSCSVKAEPPAATLRKAETLARSGGVDWDAIGHDFRKAVGCIKCRKLGYMGRNVIAEVLEMTPQIAEALRRKASLDELRTIAVGEGMTTMAADGVRKAAAGLTTLDEVLGTLSIL
ncbi:MAG: ATPase, T2SS/T4P/T4SS family [Phycisphaerae bacterium]|jgi:excisionase family DNA binding protein